MSSNQNLITLTLAGATGLPKDETVFAFAFYGSDIPDGSFDGLDVACMAWLNTNSTSYATRAIRHYLASHVSRATGGVTIRRYTLDGHLDGSPHGSPKAEATSTLLAHNGESSLAAEVAVCATIRALDWGDQEVEGPLVSTIPTPESAQDMGAPATHSGQTRPRERYTGRVFVGPLTDLAVEHDGSGYARPSSIFCTVIREAFQTMCSLANSSGHKYTLWSRRDAVLRDVVRVETDDAFDTQRRRGVAPTGRTNLALTNTL